MKDNKASNTRIVFIIAVIFELFLAIPGIGWLTGTFLSGGSVYVATFIINVIALIVVSGSHRGSVVPPIIGIAGSFLGFIPFVGWFIHVMATIFYLISIVELSSFLLQEEDSEKTKEIMEKTKESKNNDKKIKDAEIVG